MEQLLCPLLFLSPLPFPVVTLVSPTLVLSCALFFIIIPVIFILPLVLSLGVLILSLCVFEMNVPIKLHMIRNIIVVY